MLSVTLYLACVAALSAWVCSPSFLPTNSLNIKRRPDEELDDWLKKFSWNFNQVPSAPGSFPSYKFYSEIVELLLNLARRLGGNYQDSLLFLREGLQSDRQFEKKMKEAVMGCWLQMLLILLLTWAFIAASLTIVEVKVSPLKLLGLGLWQGLGLSALPLLLGHFRRRLFGDIGKLWKMLYVLNALGKVPLSRGEVFTLAGVQELKHLVRPALSHLVLKLKDLCQRSLKQGGSYEAEVKSLMEELRFQEKWHFELFEKRLAVIKLVLLSVFFLPSYLAFIFLLLGDLMALM